ncbi:hypothetical protein MPH_00849 [Macrophomina phaseolina MS6]|uniref:Uncharacterized protein n=1 Tax=Macrophomina phaseolina (strain MS6) TaxID=1126212 RepID=K2SHJ3_MACPH|nr:hypothetical protein MPH_00849 [Macrophomina phaseolina MS6]
MLIVETQPIFSVTATEKSFVLGVLRLQKRGFVQMLVRKTIGHLLPTDLTVIIEDDLFKNYWARTVKTWERTDGLWKEGHPGLYWERYMTEDALRAWCKLAVRSIFDPISEAANRLLLPLSVPYVQVAILPDPFG